MSIYLGLRYSVFFPISAVLVVLFPLVARWKCPISIIMVKTIPQTFAMSEFTPVVITVPRCLSNTNIHDLTPKSIEQIMWNILHLKTNYYISLPFLNLPNKSQSLQHDILHNFVPNCTKCPCVTIIYQGSTITLSRLAS